MRDQISKAVDDIFMGTFEKTFNKKNLSKIDSKFLCIRIIEIFTERYFLTQDDESRRYILPAQRELGF